MKILQIDVNFDHSSTGRLVKELKFGLEELGHDVYCFYGRGPLSEVDNTMKISSLSEVYFHAALTRLTGLTGIYSPIATNSIISRINALKPDLVHLHELHGYFVDIYAIINYLKINNIPTVWTFHCEFMYTGKCGHALECNRWQKTCYECPQVHEYPKSYYFDFTKYMHSQKKNLFNGFENLKIITPSAWLANRVKQSFLKNKMISVIYNGIDIKCFYPRNKIALREKYNIKSKYVFVSIAPNLISEIKGGRWVVKLANELSYLDATFIMIGLDKPEEIKFDNIIALPKIWDKDVIAEYYSMADFTILTSMKETFSLVCAESLACGTPIIGYEAGAPTEVAPVRFGKFAEYGDFNSLLEILTESIVDGESFANTQECFEYASNNFSNEKMIHSYLVEYESLLKLHN